MVLGNNQFKCAGCECNRFVGSFGHYVGAGLFFLFSSSFLFFGAFVYFRAHPFFSNICFLNGFIYKKRKRKKDYARRYGKNVAYMNSLHLL